MRQLFLKNILLDKLVILLAYFFTTITLTGICYCYYSKFFGFAKIAAGCYAEPVKYSILNA